MTSDHLLFTSESVIEGHPDKVCDRISDPILDAILTQDPHACVAVETITTTGLVHVAGEVTAEAYVEIPQVIREEALVIGYNSSRVGLGGALYGMSVSIDQQNPNIASGVDRALGVREGSAHDKRDSQGAGGQGIISGYTCNDTPGLMPAPIWLAHRLAKRLAQVRHGGETEGLRPDGKTQVTLAYEEGRPIAIDTVPVSTQHDEALSNRALIDLVASEMITPVLDECGLKLACTDMSILVNPSRRFVIGSPAGDTGLTGRKITIDTYEGMARHGGGALSGKDPPEVDCSTTYAARWAAKNVVTAGLVSRCGLQLAYTIERAYPVGLYVDTFGTGIVEDHRIADATTEAFDLRLADMIEDLDLLCPIYKEASTYGRFGQRLFPWEALNRVDALKAAVG